MFIICALAKYNLQIVYLNSNPCMNIVINNSFVNTIRGNIMQHIDYAQHQHALHSTKYTLECLRYRTVC